MKKLILSLVVLCACVPAFAQLEQGQHLLGARIGAGFQLENSGISYPDDRVDWGTLGLEYGLSYYYLITDHFGLGADVSYGNFEGGTFFVSSDKVDDKTQLFNAMLSARFTFNPSNLFRIYIPAGAGLTVAHQHMRIDRHGVDYGEKATDKSFGWFVGAGLEFDLGSGSNWSMGLEARYNMFNYDTSKLTRNAPSTVQDDGNRHLSYLSFHLRINRRF